MNSNTTRQPDVPLAKTSSVQITHKSGKPVLVALTGHMGSGKTEARKYLQSKGFKLVRIKDSLNPIALKKYKNELQALSERHKMSPETLLEEKPEGVRELMREVGASERAKDPFVFVKAYEKTVEHRLNWGVNIVTDDIRFWNEAEVVKDFDGILIKIERKGCDGKDEDGTTHETEADIKNIIPNWVVQNNSSILDLQEKLEGILENHGYKPNNN